MGQIALYGRAADLAECRHARERRLPRESGEPVEEDDVAGVVRPSGSGVALVVIAPSRAS